MQEKKSRTVIVLLETTYWGKSFGLMLLKDAITKENLRKYFVKSESNAMYKKGIDQLKLKGFEIAGIVCDGRRGLINSLKSIAVQICQFHQAAIVRRYITESLRMPAAKELKGIHFSFETNL